MRNLKIESRIIQRPRSLRIRESLVIACAWHSKHKQRKFNCSEALPEVGNKNYDKDKTYEIACIAVEHLRRGDSHEKVQSVIATGLYVKNCHLMRHAERLCKRVQCSQGLTECLQWSDTLPVVLLRIQGCHVGRVRSFD